MRYTFVLSGRNGTILIEGVTKRGIPVAFNIHNLKDIALQREYPDTRWIVSDKVLRSITKRVKVFVRTGPSPWISLPGQLYTDGSNEIEVCNRWLKKLFGRIPTTLYIRETRMK